MNNTPETNDRVKTGFSGSEAINELAAALAKAQGQIAPAIKDAENPHFKSSYADINAVIEAGRKALADNGIAVLQVPRTSEAGVSVETILAHASGQWISGGGDYTVPVDKGTAQAAGSALTYARRYSLQALLRIGADDDDGNAAEAAPPKKKAAAKKQGGRTKTVPPPAADDGSAAARKALGKKAKEDGIATSAEEFMAAARAAGAMPVGVEKFTDLTKEQCTGFLENWEAFCALVEESRKEETTS